MLNVDVIVAELPGASVPTLQGKALVQLPALATQVSPAGSGSVTITLVAEDGPRFETLIVYTMSWPGAAEEGPLLVTPTSAWGTMVVVVVDALSPASGSLMSDETVAVLMTAAPL